jgi:hypothetical protein
MVTFERVRVLALALPSAEEAISYGTPAFKVRGKLFARLREDGTLMVKTELGRREALIATQPDRYFTTPHYADHPSVLVRLEHADEGDLADLLTDAWLMVAPKRLAASFAASEPAP